MVLFKNVLHILLTEHLLGPQQTKTSRYDKVHNLICLHYFKFEIFFKNFKETELRNKINVKTKNSLSNIK